MNYKRKRIRIASEFLALLFGPGPRSFHVTKNAMPEDSLVVGARFDPFDPTVVELLVESASFEEVREGGVIPEVMPELTVTSMRWTPEKPTRSGWYWYRDRELFAIRPTLLLLEFDERRNPWIRMMGDFTRDRMTPVDSKFNGLWAGPLTPPEEEK